MITTTVKALQSNTEQLINRIIANGDVVYVEAEKGTAVIITLDEWNAFRELLAYEMNTKS